MRRRSGSRALLTVLWLAYLLADTVAIFVLGHLAVYVRGPSHELMFFWAAFVLVHLGGQDNITAFSKQDNELWTRHLLSLVSQVVVAGYVVSKSSWPDVRLSAAMVLMFIHGVLKYAGRTLCLYSVSPKNLGASSLSSLSTTIGRLQRAQDEVNSSSDNQGGYIVTKEAGERTIKEGQFKEMFVPKRCWKYVSSLSATMTLAAEDIMSVDAPVNDVEMIVFADVLPDLLEEFKDSPDRCTAYQFVAAALYLSSAIALALFAVAEKKSHYSEADIIVCYLLLL
ncbi:unnamed protein product [Urochloa humidicola]